MNKMIILLVVLIIAFIAFYLTRPGTYKVERSIVINAPASQVWEQVAYFKNWQNWSPWVEKDSSVANTYEGVDGALGAISSYTSKKSGSGKMVNTGVKENEEVLYSMHFLEPWDSKSDGFIRLEKHENGTKVSWGFAGDHNFFTKFMNMDKMIGPDFHRGMELLKNLVESAPKPKETRKLKVKQGTFAAINYLAKRYRDLPMTEISPAFFGENYAELISTESDFAEEGIPSAIYFTWDMENNKTDMAIVLPLNTLPTEIPAGCELVTFEESNSFYVEYYGKYEEMEVAHDLIHTYFNDNNIDPNKVAIEQYVSDPIEGSDPADWLTKIVYLD